MKYFYTLCILFALFLIRVFAQLFQYYFEFEFLPSFDSWHSGALPYELLLFFHLIIVFFCVNILIKVKNGIGVKNKYAVKFLQVFGLVYFFVMLFRLFLGMTFMVNHYWMDNLLPTVFHIILAVFILTYHNYLRERSNG